MPKPALNKPQSYIHIYLTPDDKQAFSNWCQANGMTMSEVVRGEIKSKIDEGYKLR